MPILWPEELFIGLPNTDFEPSPPAIGGRWATIDVPRSPGLPHPGILHQQKRKLQADWQKVKALLLQTDEETYTYFWLIVNTRSFYYVRPGIKIKPPRDNCMALCPFIDYFNHADQGCIVDFNDEGFFVTSDRAYEPGEEIFTSYGGHSNDFLMMEYGFVLDENKWDSLLLDDLILPHLNTKTIRDRLLDAGYLGFVFKFVPYNRPSTDFQRNYNLSTSGICFRTQVAIHAIFLDQHNFRRFVHGKPVDHNLNNTASVAEFLGSKIIFKYWYEAQKAIEGYKKYGKHFLNESKEVLVMRWAQIQRLLMAALENEGQAAEDVFWEMINQGYGGSLTDEKD